MSAQFLGDTESLKDLESRMMSPDREIYQSFRHMRVESAFLGRIYIIYKPTGLGEDNLHRDPDVLGQVKVTSFRCEGKYGCEIEFEDTATGEVMRVGHVPKRLFDYDVFIAVPPLARLRWDGRYYEGSVRRSLAFGILIKTRTRSDYYSAGATMAETPKGFRSLYPNFNLQLQYV